MRAKIGSVAGSRAAVLVVGLGLAGCGNAAEPASGATSGPTSSATTSAAAAGPELGAWHALVADPTGGDGVLLVNGLPEDARDARPLELWRWDGSAWTLVTADPDGPPARNFAAVSADTGRGVLVVHGGQWPRGQGESETSGETLEWDGTAWRVIEAADGPGPRSAAAMTYDSHAGVSVLYGGDAGGPVRGDTWTWDGATWTQVAENGPEPIRWPAAFAYDPALDQVVLYGGHQVVVPDGPPALGDTWTWDGATWQLAESVSAPGPLVNASAFTDPARDALVLVGGSDMTGPSGAAWTWTGAALVADRFARFPATSGTRARVRRGARGRGADRWRRDTGRR